MLCKGWKVGALETLHCDNHTSVHQAHVFFLPQRSQDDMTLGPRVKGGSASVHVSNKRTRISTLRAIVLATVFDCPFKVQIK